MAISTVTNNPVKNDGATILGAGTTNDNKINNLSLAENAYRPDVGAKVILAVSPSESGVLGTSKVISSGIFANPGKDQYTAMIIGKTVAGIPNNVLTSPSSTNYPTLNYGRGYRRINITEWDYVTGEATKGPNAGDLVTYWAPLDNTAINVEKYPNDLIPGQFVYMSASLIPVMADYPSRS